MVDFAAHTANIINRIGHPVTLTPSGQAARVVNAVFTANPSDAFGIVSGSRMQLRVGDVDSAGLAQGDPVVIGTKTYTISSIEDDSADSGDRLLRLESA